MHRSLAGTLALLAMLAHLVVSLLPSGTALCIGGGHGFGETVAALCDEACFDAAGATDAVCGGDAERSACAHHRDEHSAPCTDIPASDQDGRLQAGDRPGREVIQATPAPAWATWSHGFSVAMSSPPRVLTASLPPWEAALAAPPRALRASLRSIVLRT